MDEWERIDGQLVDQTKRMKGSWGYPGSEDVSPVGTINVLSPHT